MSAPQERYLCIHVPEFPAQARLRHRTALRKSAVAILEGVPPLQTVCSVTRPARMMNITKGTTRAELDSFTGVHVLLRSPEEEHVAAAALLATLWNVSPRAQVLPAREGAHRIVLDITGTERLFGPPQQLAEALLQQAEALGLVAQAAASSNFNTAVCLAQYAVGAARIVDRGREREALARLPVAGLESLTEEQHSTFELWGLHTLGEIAALPEEQLIARMGQAGKQLWLLSRGEQSHLMQPEEERFTLEERTAFDAPVEMLDSLLFVLGPMLDQLVLRASGRALALASVTVNLQLTNHAADETAAPQEAGTYTRTVKPALPLADSRVLLKLLHLELQAHPPGAPVTGIHLHAEPGGRARAQLGLFSPQLPEPSRLDVTLARIRALVGEGRVGRPRLLDTHQPDSFTVERFTVPQDEAKVHHAKPEETSASDAGAQRPGAVALRRLRPPVLLRMEVVHGRPHAFYWQGSRHEVTAAYGPWRGSGNWWSTAAWSLEEWDVTATASSGATLVCRMARDLLHRHWRMEGMYD